MLKKRGYTTVKVQLAQSQLTLYGSDKLVSALKAMTADMTLYQGVKFQALLEAVYEQGKKDGRGEVYNQVEKDLKDAQKALPYKRPGRPKKK